MEVRPLTNDLRSSVTPNFSRSASSGGRGEEEDDGAAAAAEAEAMAAEIWGGMEMPSERDLMLSACLAASATMADLISSALLEASAASSFDFLAVSETRSAILAEEVEEVARAWDFFAASSAKVFARFHRSSIVVGLGWLSLRERTREKVDRERERERERLKEKGGERLEVCNFVSGYDNV